MIYLRLFWEFFKTGLFAIGGGMATLPFLHDIGEATGWFTQAQLMNMLAVSESTPGPIGINMATYVGFTVAGVPGAVIATLGEVTPSIIVILIIAALLRNFRENRYVDRAFYGLRPASTGLIGAACVSVVLEVLTNIVVASPETGLFNQFQLGDGGLAGLIELAGPDPGGGAAGTDQLGETHEESPSHRVHRRLGGDRRGLPVLKKSRAVCAARDFLVYSAGEATRKRKSLPPSSSGKAPYMEKLYRKRSAISTP